ncbi:pyridoxamine 5'-phosphate oxidase family protein [Gammaproteobacteria bacterium]|nr:pyridoxamine 5'-phosphate oxidase family protein [Gammaproteobacteria bacterium]
MINFNNLNQEIPYVILKEKYDQAIQAGQKGIEAISISSYNRETNEVDSRFVNLKIINNNELIFFSNYKSEKSIQFEEHNQIAAIFYWDSINTQIRMKATIKKTPINLNKSYFKKRSKEKNALAISSKQSKKIISYEKVLKNFQMAYDNSDLTACPEYWGGYAFTPYYFEFWEGHSSRLNKRDFYEFIEGNWNNGVLQP